MSYSVYSILCFENGREYIGRFKNKTSRIKDHKRCLIRGAHKNKQLQKDWNSFGSTMFLFTILFDGLDKDDAIDKERELIEISKMNSTYNIQNGGHTGPLQPLPWGRLSFNPA